MNRYFKTILFTLSSLNFYQKYVHLPPPDSTPAFIHSNPKFWPFFAGALGAIDGTHITCFPNTLERHAARNRKGGVSQNCFAACSWDLRFLFFISGWGGSTSDAVMYHDAQLNGFRISPGKYYLADAGFGICDSLLVPYRGTRYHLAEWGCAGVRYVFDHL